MNKVRPKIAILLPSLEVGGVEIVFLRIAYELAKQLDVDLVLVEAKGEYLERVPRSVRIVNLRAGRALRALPTLVNYLRSEHPTALLVAKDYMNIIALWARRLARVPVHTVISVHINPTMNAKNATSFREKLIPLLIRIFYPWADAVIAVSQGVAEEVLRIARLPEDRIHVVYNPVVSSDIFTKAEEPVDHPWFLPGEPPVILGVGRLTAQKDFSTLIRAFALVLKRRSAKLVILGEGEERPHLESLVQELGLEAKVSMPGFVDNPYKYMKRAAVFVLSSRWEGLPTVLIEAMACGCPVVSTDCPSGPREILEQGKWGPLVPIGDEKALAEAIVQTLKQPLSCEALMKRALDFSVDWSVQQYLELLLERYKK